VDTVVSGVRAWAVEVVAGSGEMCVGDDDDHCGDGQLATHAALSHPKGTNYSRSPTFHAHGLTFFSESVVNAWNFLPDIVDFSSLSRFKRSIHNVDFSRFLKCF